MGLGPYDLPPPEPPARATAWSFTDGKAHGWQGMMNVADFGATADGLAFRSTSRDPALMCTFAPVTAADYARVVVKMKVTGAPTTAQLFWAGPNGSVSESTSVRVPVVCDGAFHAYVFPVGAARTWRGRVHHFRFDPVDVKDAQVVIASIRLEGEAK